jgi:hypothetical protein
MTNNGVVRDGNGGAPRPGKRESAVLLGGKKLAAASRLSVGRVVAMEWALVVSDQNAKVIVRQNWWSMSNCEIRHTLGGPKLAFTSAGTVITVPLPADKKNLSAVHAVVAQRVGDGHLHVEYGAALAEARRLDDAEAQSLREAKVIKKSGGNAAELNAAQSQAVKNSRQKLFTGAFLGAGALALAVVIVWGLATNQLDKPADEPANSPLDRPAVQQISARAWLSPDGTGGNCAWFPGVASDYGGSYVFCDYPAP